MKGARGVWVKRALIALGGVVIVLVTIVAVSRGSNEGSSICVGTTARGALRNGWQLPRSGANFRAYSDAGWVAGRTYVHSAVHAVMLDAYQRLATSSPEQRFIYGETGFAEGGPFKPHRTHQNGLSVDFMVPVRDSSGAVREISTSATDKFGYDLEFDDDGKLGELRVDFEAIAAHLAELKLAAKSRGLRISKVIFEPALRAKLARTKAWPSIKDLPFTTKPVWIRHDEHYHVDFETRCEPLAKRN
jgi:penicillin-insensitive murein endopeptidase